MKEIDDIHVPFKEWLNERHIPFVYHRPDQKSGIAQGHPDFTIFWMSHCLCIEAKTQTGKLSEKQAARIKYIRASGNAVEICRSLEECIEATHNILLAGGRKVPDLLKTQHNGPLVHLFQAMREAVAGEKLFVVAMGGKDVVMTPSDGMTGYSFVRNATGADAGLPRGVPQ